MFISPAYAQVAGSGGGGGDFISGILPLVLIFAVFYFLLIRPQQKKMKEHKAKVAAVRRGDKVVTGGGILGTVTKVGTDNEIQVEIAKDIKVRIATHTLSDVLTKPEPAAANDQSGSGGGGKTSLLGGILGGFLGKK